MAAADEVATEIEDHGPRGPPRRGRTAAGAEIATESAVAVCIRSPRSVPIRGGVDAAAAARVPSEVAGRDAAAEVLYPRSQAAGRPRCSRPPRSPDEVVAAAAALRSGVTKAGFADGRGLARGSCRVMATRPRPPRSVSSAGRARARGRCGGSPARGTLAAYQSLVATRPSRFRSRSWTPRRSRPADIFVDVTTTRQPRLLQRSWPTAAEVPAEMGVTDAGLVGGRGLAHGREGPRPRQRPWRGRSWPGSPATSGRGSGRTSRSRWPPSSWPRRATSDGKHERRSRAGRSARRRRDLSRRAGGTITSVAIV